MSLLGMMYGSMDGYVEVIGIHLKDLTLRNSVDCFRAEGPGRSHPNTAPPAPQYLKTVLGGSEPPPQHLKTVPVGSRPPLVMMMMIMKPIWPMWLWETSQGYARCVHINQ
jgi:hypothetical protein